MTTYIVLAHWSDQGIKNAHEVVHHVQQFRVDAERRGLKVVGTYWTMGHYDLVVIVDAPDEQMAMAGLLATCGHGNVHTETLRAFNETEMTAILQKL